MNTRSYLVLALLAAPGAHAAVHCVGDTGALQQALDESAASPEADLIQLVDAQIAVPAAGFAYVTGTAEPRDLIIRGGYQPGCLLRASGAKSVLDASTATGNYGFRIIADGSVVDVANIIFRGMPDNGDAVTNSALSIQADGGFIGLEANAFVLNAGVNGSALRIFAPRAVIKVVDTIFGDNETRSSVARISGGSAAGDAATLCELRNNTITRNGGLFSLNDCANATLVNNIVWGNTGQSLALGGSAATAGNASVHFNDIEDVDNLTVSPNITLVSSNNLDVDPQFLPGLLAFGLQPTSALIDAGDPATGSDQNPLDFVEGLRVRYGRIDMGAIEVDLTLFADGFE